MKGSQQKLIKKDKWSLANYILSSNSFSVDFEHMQIVFNKNKRPLKTLRRNKKNRNYTCNENGSKKVNNMPNLQSMSQAKGYGRLNKKIVTKRTVSLKSTVNSINRILF